MIEELILGWFTDCGAYSGPTWTAFGAHPECTDEREVAMGWSVRSRREFGRFRKQKNRTPTATATAIPPTTPPTMAGTFDLREDIGEVGEAEWKVVGEGVMEDECGGVDVGVATTNSGL